MPGVLPPRSGYGRSHGLCREVRADAVPGDPRRAGLGRCGSPEPRDRLRPGRVRPARAPPIAFHTRLPAVSYGRRWAMAKRILVPLSGRARAEAVLPVVADAARSAGATMRLLHVAPYPPATNGPLRSRDRLRRSGDRSAGGRVAGISARG